MPRVYRDVSTNCVPPLNPNPAGGEPDTDEPESENQSFVVKVWIERQATASHETSWRGYITHVFSGRRRYVQELDDISAFIGSYLVRMGVTLPKRSRLRQWLKRHRLVKVKEQGS